ncbi:unnamed protein product [Staurois parvus]|uniref:Uncharacterized protein n=1 Tax=Staurois parvus TaxID=386267 RepID=A0ABN9D4X3_9NEOB|nr:unnamed protein product [Staurois parvus]
MVRDCRHTTGDGQRLQTWYKRGSMTSDILQEMVRDYRRCLQTCNIELIESRHMLQETVRGGRYATSD